MLFPLLCPVNLSELLFLGIDNTKPGRNKGRDSVSVPAPTKNWQCHAPSISHQSTWTLATIVTKCGPSDEQTIPPKRSRMPMRKGLYKPSQLVNLRFYRLQVGCKVLNRSFLISASPVAHI